MSANWSAPTESYARRAGGRRRYNAQRQFIAEYRRTQLSRLLFCKGAFLEHGIQARLARELGVSRSTICRDLQTLLREGHPCPQCGAYTKPPPPEEEEW